MQASNVGGLRAPRGPRVVFAVALTCWAVGAVVYGALPEDSTARYLAATAVYLAAAAFVLICMARATTGARAKERLFWGLFATGLLVWLVADLEWGGLQEAAFRTQEVAYQHVAYLFSYLPLICAMMLLVSWTTRRITLLTFLDSLSIMLSVGILIWYFFLGSTVAEGTWAILAVLSWPLLDAALLFLSLVVLSTAGRPPFTGLLAAGFLAFALADGWYLWLRAGDAYGLTGWPDMFWALGFVFFGLAALRAAPIATLRSRITPWRVFAFWLGPLSPPLHLGVVLVWAATHPPLPAYAAMGAAILFFYLAVRMALVSLVSRRRCAHRV